MFVPQRGRFSIQIFDKFKKSLSIYEKIRKIMFLYKNSSFFGVMISLIELFVQQRGRFFIQIAVKSRFYTKKRRKNMFLN